jgi:hypothetical protein
MIEAFESLFTIGGFGKSMPGEEGPSGEKHDSICVHVGSLLRPMT